MIYDCDIMKMSGAILITSSGLIVPGTVSMKQQKHQIDYNPLASGKCGNDSESIISENMLHIKFMSTSCETDLR